MLDSRGNRLRISGAKYDRYIKRLNAEDKAAWFTRWEGTGTDPYSGQNEFRYDPNGDQIFSFKGGLRQYTVAKTFQIVRDVSASYSSDGEVQMIRKHTGNAGNYNTVITDDYANATNDMNLDASYSGANGIVDSTEWTGVVLFGVPSVGAGIALEAPQTAVLADPRCDTIEGRNRAIVTVTVIDGFIYAIAFTGPVGLVGSVAAGLFLAFGGMDCVVGYQCNSGPNVPDSPSIR